MNVSFCFLFSFDMQILTWAYSFITRGKALMLKLIYFFMSFLCCRKLINHSNQVQTNGMTLKLYSLCRSCVLMLQPPKNKRINIKCICNRIALMRYLCSYNNRVSSNVFHLVFMSPSQSISPALIRTSELVHRDRYLFIVC
jgi:hypothetical protein